MKIAVVSSGLGHVARGVEAWADDLGSALYRRGIAVTLFKGGGTAARPFERVLRCAQRDRKIAKCLATVGKRYFWRHGFGSPYTVEQQSFASSLIPELAAGRYDIVHMQDPWLAWCLEQARRKGKHHAKVILAHGTEEPLEFLQQFEHVQELAPYYLERDRQETEVRIQKTEIGGLKSSLSGWYAIPNFVNADRFSPSVVPLPRKEIGIPENAFVILCVSAIKRTHKRVDAVIDAVAQLRDQTYGRQSSVSGLQPSLHLVVAGATERETPDVIAYGKRQLGENVTFFENFDRSNMPSLYRTADVMLHGSLVEMMPISLLEATASGLPVIGHNWPVIEWIVRDGGTCVDAKNPANLASALTAYLSPQFRSVKSANARNRAVEMFSEEVVVRQIIEMYRQILGDGRP